MKSNLSKTAMRRARELFPGGVNSPVRAFQSVEGDPVVMDSASGPYLRDLDGNVYVDYIGSWGPMIMGHNHPSVVKSIDQHNVIVYYNTSQSDYTQSAHHNTKSAVD